jgi:D-alanyl-D-alanine carboxypeptidase
VASAVRDGRRLIGVVFGGKSSRSRNTHMAKLLDEGFARARTLVAKVHKLPPVPGRKPGGAPVLVASAETAAAAGESADVEARSTTVGAYRFLPYVTEGKPETTEQVAEAPAPKAPAPKAQTGAKRAASNGKLDKPWGIQVGAYYAYVKAERAAKRAARKVPDILDGAHIWVPQSRGDRGHIYQARLMGLAEIEARTACKRLKRARRDCMVLRMPKGISTKYFGPRIEIAEAN